MTWPGCETHDLLHERRTHIIDKQQVASQLQESAYQVKQMNCDLKFEFHKEIVHNPHELVTNPSTPRDMAVQLSLIASLGVGQALHNYEMILG